MEKQTKIIGFKIHKYEAERNPDFNGKLEMKQNMLIKSVEKHKLSTSKEEVLKVKFNFEINYSNLGKILIEGIILVLVDAKTLKETLNEWKNKKLPKDMQIFLLNIILQRASIKALQIEEDLGLPPHFQLPSISPEREK